MQQEDVYMYSSKSREWKNFDEASCFVCKNSEISEVFVKYLLNIDIWQMERVTKLFTSELVLKSLKISDPIDS